MSDSDFRVLRDLITEDALVFAERDRHGNSVLVLKENAHQTEYSVRIRGVPDDILAIRTDLFPPPKFRGTRGERKRADFIIIADDGTRNWVICVELKGGKKSTSEIEQQLNGSRCLLAYCRAIGRTFWPRGDFLDERKYIERFVSVMRISMNKRPSRRRASKVHDTPGRMLRINSPGNNRLSFTQLTGGDADLG